MRSLAALRVLAAGAPACGRGPPNAADLEAELVCPVCETTLDQSNAPVAERMKAFIRERIAAGRHGAGDQGCARRTSSAPGVLATPPKSGFGLLAWLAPARRARRGRDRRRPPRSARGAAGAAPPDAERPLDPELERRVDEELARFEG